MYRLLLIFFLCYLGSSQPILESPDQCPSDLLVKFQDPDVVPVPGNSVCSQAAKDHLDYCTCFKWPEAVQAVETIIGQVGDCVNGLTVPFTMQTALDACDETTLCDEVLHEDLCTSKNCHWNDAGSCVDNDGDWEGSCKDEDELVAAVAKELETAWITDCPTLLAVMDHYRNENCDSEVLFLWESLQTAAPEGVVYDQSTTLRDLCCETCWYDDSNVPYVFGDLCETHDQCNDGDQQDYFCADCTKCEDDNSSEFCGICDLSSYGGTACVELFYCTEERSIDGECNYRYDTICSSAETVGVSDVEACEETFPPSQPGVIVQDNACDCLSDENFPDVQTDCVWTHDYVFTIQEEIGYCNEANCNDIYSEISCVSHHNPKCVWLERLVKGVCVDDPCYNDQQSICDETCQFCQADDLGEVSCGFNFDALGHHCNDTNKDTINDVCDAEAQGCKGISIEESIALPIELNKCMESSDLRYECEDEVLTVISSCLNVNNTESRLMYQADGTCSNVLIDDGNVNKWYFSATCNANNDGMLNRAVCSYEAYLTEASSNSWVLQPMDSSAEINLFVVCILLLINMLN